MCHSACSDVWAIGHRQVRLQHQKRQKRLHLAVLELLPALAHTCLCLARPCAHAGAWLIQTHLSHAAKLVSAPVQTRLAQPITLMSCSVCARSLRTATSANVLLGPCCSVSIEARLFEVSSTLVVNSFDCTAATGEKSPVLPWQCSLNEPHCLRLFLYWRDLATTESTPQCRINKLEVWSYELFIVLVSSSSGSTSRQILEILCIINHMTHNKKI